jgi:hypothetical protein
MPRHLGNGAYYLATAFDEIDLTSSSPLWHFQFQESFAAFSNANEGKAFGSVSS